MDEVPDGTTFDLLPNEGAALYLDNPTSSKGAPVNLNDSLEDDSNNGLEDSLDFANENAVELAEPALTGSLQLSDVLTENEAEVTSLTQAMQESSQPSNSTSVLDVTQSASTQPTPLSQLTKKATTAANCTQEGDTKCNSVESASQGHKIAPSFGKKKAVFKPPKMDKNATGTVPRQLEEGKTKQMDTPPGKVTAKKSTPLQSQPSAKELDEIKKGNETCDKQESSEMKLTKVDPGSKPAKAVIKRKDDEGKGVEKELRKAEAEKKKLQQQQKKLEKQRKLEEKEAERERKRQDRERKEREREEKRQEKERKSQERAQKKREKELKEQGKEIKKQKQDNKRLMKEKEDKDIGMMPKVTHDTIALSPATVSTSADRESKQRELQLTDTKDNDSGSRETAEGDEGAAEHEEVEDESNGHMETVTNSDGDLDTTVEGNCPDDQDEKHDSPSVRQNEASTNKNVSDMSTESDTHCSAEPLTEGNPMTIPKGVNALSNAPATKKKFTPPNVPKVTAPQKRSAAAGESNSRPSKKVKTMCAEENNAPQPKLAKVKAQKLKAEGKAEKHLQKQTLGAATVRPEKPLPVWVQCGSCQKWRVVHDCADPSTLPDEWKCDMNSDVSVQSCSVPEIDWPDLTNSQEYVYSQFTRGSVVWAKQQGYPSWPGMIDNDPDIGVCMSWEEENPPEDIPPSEYHIVYFGKPVSRAWVEANDVAPFSEDCPEAEGHGVYAKALGAAKREAQAALQETTEVRLSKYSFAKRYGKGKRKTKQCRTIKQDDEEVLPSKRSRRLTAKTPLKDNDCHEMVHADTSEVVGGESTSGEREGED